MIHQTRRRAGGGRRELFENATAGAVDGPWTLHQLRHSALTHAAEAGANTSTLLSYSGHTSVASLARYARISREALARWQTNAAGRAAPLTRGLGRPSRQKKILKKVEG